MISVNNYEIARNILETQATRRGIDANFKREDWDTFNGWKKRGKNIEFIGTGQTGILLSGHGIPVDAVTGDFMAGEVEYAIDQIDDDKDLIIVEGQGSLTNMYYAGVTLGLLHGAMPDYMLMTHDPSRDLDVTDFPMTTMKHVMDLHLDLMKSFKQSRFIGINLLTFAFDNEKALKIIENSRKEFNMETTDLIRFGDKGLLDAIEGVL